MPVSPGPIATADGSHAVETSPVRSVSARTGRKALLAHRYTGLALLVAFVLCTPATSFAQSALRQGGVSTAHKSQPSKAKGKSETSLSPVRKGPAPKQPTAVPPQGTPRSQPNAEVRRAIAGGSTDEDRAAPLDAELQVLQEAERALFPRQLPGVHPGWSWDLENTNVEPDGPPGASILPPEIKSPPSQVVRAEVGKWLSELTPPNLPSGFQPNVVTYLQFYRTNPQGKSILRTWYKRSGRYSKLIVAELAKAGLPTDLLWQSLIESGHNPNARSVAGAVGLWQFMPETARAYGLEVDRWTDERLDPQRSTEAAARLLADLHRRFGNWELALAAYNMGHAGLSRSIRKYNSNDFWLLSHYEGGLPWETTLYVPKIVALAIAMNNRAAFGIDDVEPEPASQFDVVSVGPGQPLAVLAKAAGVSESIIAELNPQFLAGRTPPTAQSQKANSYSVRVPQGSGAIVSRKIASLSPADADYDSYTIRQGDTLESIAKSTSLSVAELRTLNQVASTEILAPGDTLLVPRRDRPTEVDLAEDEKVVVIPKDAPARSGGANRVFYRVVPGDTLSGIAKSFGVKRSELLEWNSIDTTARLQAKMVLAVWLPADAQPPKARYLAQSDVRVLVAGSQEFAEYFEGLRGNDRVIVHSKQGDTLTTIAGRYHVNAATLERVNRRSRSARLNDGESVVVYVPQSKGVKTTRPPAEAAKASPAAGGSAIIPVSTPKTTQGAPSVSPDSG